MSPPSPSLILTEVDLRALRALALFRYLTVHQMKALGVGRDDKHLRDRLAALEKAKLIRRGTKTFDTFHGHGVPALHWITKTGAATLHELEGVQTTAPGGGAKTSADVVHRQGVVALHIALRCWATAAGVTVQWVKAYYERGEGERSQATTFRWAEGVEWPEGEIRPDLVALLGFPDGKTRALALEYERGGARGDLKGFYKKLDTYRAAIDAGALEDALELSGAVRWGVVFATPDMLTRAMTTWPRRDGDANLWGRFFFKSLQDAQADFNTGWHGLGHPRRNLF